MEIKVVSSDEKYAQCLAVRKRVFVDEQGVSLKREIDEFEDTCTHFIIYDEEVPVGTVRYRPVSDDMVKIERMAVIPEKRGCNYGQALLEYVHEYARKHKFKRAKLSAQTHAAEFYEKMGYRITSGTFQDAGMPHVHMNKDL